MKLKNNYFILRHGQTIYQTKKKKDIIYPSFSKKPPVEITPKGENQIKKAAKKLEKEKIEIIFSSDFFRTKQTARIVNQKIKKRIFFDKRLRDINFGNYHGKSKKDFYKEFPKFSVKRFYHGPKRGENWLDCQKRMAQFLKEIDKKFNKKTILIISHGDPIWLLEGVLKNQSPEELIKIRKEKGIPDTGELRKLKN